MMTLIRGGTLGGRLAMADWSTLHPNVLANEGYIPGFIRMPIGRSYSYIPDSSDEIPVKMVWHTIQGSAQSGINTFKSKGINSHWILDIENRRVYQLVPLGRSSATLRNAPGEPETNRANAIQVEMSGFAEDMHLLSDRDLQWIGEFFLAPIMAAVPELSSNYVENFGEDAGFVLARSSAKQRFSPVEWLQFGGHCGHQHVPENDHWDPGGFDIGSVVKHAQAKLTAHRMPVNKTVPKVVAPGVTAPARSPKRKSAAKWIDPDKSWPLDPSGWGASNWENSVMIDSICGEGMERVTKRELWHAVGLIRKRNRHVGNQIKASRE